MNKVILKIDKLIEKHKKIIIFLLFMPYAYHASLPSGDIAIAEFIKCRLIIINLILLIFYGLFIKKIKITPLIIINLIGVAWIQFSTIINNPDKSYNSFLYGCSSLAIILLVSCFYDDINSLLKSTLLCFELQIYPNMITTILYSKVPTTTYGYNLNHFFLGTANDMILYLMPAFCLCTLYIYYNKIEKRPIILMISIIITVLFSDSLTTIISLSFFVFVYCLFLVLQKLNVKIKNIYLIILIPVLMYAIVCLPYFLFGKNYIIDFVLNNIYYNHSFESRIFMWVDAKRYVLSKPFTGYGYYSQLVQLIDNDIQIHGTAHNTLIQRTINYGIVGLILFVIYNYEAVRKLNKMSDLRLRRLFTCFVCSVFITYITQDFHRFFEFNLIFALAYYLGKLKLEPISISNTNDFYKLKCDASNILWTGWNDKPKYEDIESFVKDCVTNNKSNKDRKVYLAKIENEIVGYVYIDYVDDETIHISPAIDSKYQGNGYGKEIIKLAIKKGKEFGFTKAEAYIREDNIVSLKCFEYNGMLKTDIYSIKYIENLQKEVKMIRYAGPIE